MPNNSFQEHCRKIAKRFLLTAVVVDDELSVVGDPNVRTGLRGPSRSPMQSTAESQPRQTEDAPRPLGVNAITSSFARHGIICGVVAPPSELDGDAMKRLVRVAARSDIVILDWRLNRESGQDSFPLLRQILLDDQAHRLRLIAFYTGEPPEDIRSRILEGLTDLGGPLQPAPTPDSEDDAIQVGPCRILVYGKHGLPTLAPSDAATEDELPDRLIADFGAMVEGLLPVLVLTALGAVRENVSRILERFRSDLDPAFLAHRACLPAPQDSQGHMVEQIASELRGVMDDAVQNTRPAGIGAIEHWLRNRFDDRNVVFLPGRKEMSMSEIMDMLTHGIEKERGPLKKDGKDYHLMSYGFSDGDENSKMLDQRLASAMSFREVIEKRTQKLSIGTVVRMVESEPEATLLCVTPRCDSVRLKDPSLFLFLPLSNPKSDTLQLVVPTTDGGYERRTICMNPSRWRTATFRPDTELECVLSSTHGENPYPFFKDLDDQVYQWVGELKAEFAQSVAQAIAERMSRVGLNKSEWLRRSESVGERGS